MSDDERYNGWSNRETWAVALHINNDQGWQESMLDALREVRDANDEPYGDEANFQSPAGWAGDIIRENVEERLDFDQYATADAVGLYRAHVLPVVQDIGSLWRVNWTELGASFLKDLDES